jgi:hypothetical protein
MNSPNPFEELKRTIALIYGILANGNPFWAFVAVRSNKYAIFVSDQKEGKIDMTNFTPYGEIIICGEGKSPPDDITLKVAEMYQTDPEKLKHNVEEEMKAAQPIIDKALSEQ